MTPDASAAPVDYRTDPSRYKHWTLQFEGPVATLVMAIDEDGGLREGYKLKLNSYDLGVDIELYDAVQRIRFEHPEVRTVVVTSGRERVFCSGVMYMPSGARAVSRGAATTSSRRGESRLKRRARSKTG